VSVTRTRKRGKFFKLNVDGIKRIERSRKRVTREKTLVFVDRDVDIAIDGIYIHKHMMVRHLSPNGWFNYSHASQRLTTSTSNVNQTVGCSDRSMIRNLLRKTNVKDAPSEIVGVITCSEEFNERYQDRGGKE
jgi:hypothetical protein